MPSARLYQRRRRALSALALAVGLRSAEATAQIPPAAPAEPPLGVAAAPATPASGPAAQSAASRTPRAESALAWSGASLFALTYLGSALAATTAYATPSGTDSSRAALWIPAVGPWVMLGSRGSAAQDTLVVLDGVAQAVGLTMFVYGLASSPVAVSVTPSAARGAPGAALLATF